MKKLLIYVVFLISATSFAQILDPVKWSTSVNKISDSEYELVATAKIDNKWHLYSQNVPEGGPIATSFTYEGNGKYLKKEIQKEGVGHTIHDKMFDMEIKYFETVAAFKQRIKLKDKIPFDINGTVEFMVCDDMRCLPPKEVELTFVIE